LPPIDHKVVLVSVFHFWRMDRLLEDQDTVLLVLYQQDKISDFYIVSLEILRLFPLTYLNELFPAGIPFGAFLTGQQVKDIYALLNPTASQLVSNDSCTNLFNIENQDELGDIRMMYDSDGSHMHSFDGKYKYLFEKVPSGASEIAMQKGVHVHADQDLFDYFGIYFQRVVAIEIDGIKNNRFPSLSDMEPKEFMCFKEHIDIYCILNSECTTTSKEKIVLGCTPIEQNSFVAAAKEYLLSKQEPAWMVEGLEKPLSILEFMRTEQEKEFVWDIIKALDQRKSVVKYCVIPILTKRIEKQFSSDEIIVSSLVTQVAKTRNFLNVQDAIRARKSFLHTHWQHLPAYQLKKNTKEERIGTLWLRRTWAVEFSRTLFQ
jgi:hypothetical protein